MRQRMKCVEVAIVGAGAAGVGVGIALQDLGLNNFVIVDRGRVGESFRRWPREMRFITPSFYSNGFGLLDLNSVSPTTSPAFTLGEQNPTGLQYAAYLEALATYRHLPAETKTNVHSITRDKNGRFLLRTDREDYEAQYLIWGTGEFQYPNRCPFVGSEHCVHTSCVQSWAELSGSEFAIIGGFESGVDAATHLASTADRITLIDRNPIGISDDPDPSGSLVPTSALRLRDLLDRDKLVLRPDFHVVAVERTSDAFVIRSHADDRVTVSSPPLLATGFLGGQTLIQGLFENDPEGFPMLTPQDESVKTQGLFLVGPKVRHEGLLFCFIYKFRQRFAVVAAAIGERLGVDTSDFIDYYREAGMYLDDFSCCGESCEC
ncbi:putative oxidoreductase CzcO [Planctomycetes bacterium Pan216]|uniref:Putative oxidoreductase CzcO n=1 Tax=Kolteria novifilia TaxID=2527975 RepID=A0A518BBE2_9BACT|nr:putative oxidoreductase CzcO [Planctomycetes bacterium Pan216]